MRIRHGVRMRWLVAVAVCAMLAGSPLAATAQSESGIAESDEREQQFAALAAAVTALERQGNLLKQVVRLTTPAVVHIEARKPVESRNGYRRKPMEEAGSGVIIDIDGSFYVLTNRHVVEDAPIPNIEIRFADGRTVNPANIWSDRYTDVAVMAVDESQLTPARIGDSESIEIGDFVLAVGSPFGLSHSVTYGIISAKGRRDLKLGDGSIKYQDFMQTDAAINPGNSGGPLLSLRGEVIGINTAIASSSGGSEGIGFTIPINMAMTVARQLVEDGRPTRAYLGVKLFRQDQFTLETALRLGLPRPQGALVRAVTPDSPAARAEVQPEDVIVQFDGRRIEDDDHLIQVVGFTPVGKEVELLVLRRTKSVRLKIRLEDRRRYEADG